MKKRPANGLMTRQAYADHRGVSLQIVKKAVRDGKITLTNRKIDPKTADKEWEKNVRFRTPTRADAEAKSEGAGDYFAARTRREEAMADLAELDVAERSGNLVDADSVRNELTGRVVSAREALDALADRLAPVVAAEKNQAACYKILRDEIRAACSALAGQDEEFLTK